jgi:hypothetical protein
MYASSIQAPITAISIMGQIQMRRLSIPGILRRAVFYGAVETESKHACVDGGMKA